LPPRFTSLSPAGGDTGQTIANLILTGDNLAGVTRLEFLPAAGMAVSNFRATATTVTAQLAIAFGAVAGERSVFAHSPNARSNPLPFTVRIGPPRISALTPNVGEAGQTIAALTMAGDNLADVTAIEFSPSAGITISSLRATPTSVTAQLVMAFGAATGERSVSVVAPAGRSNTLPFTVRPASPPRITSLSPDSGEIPQTIAAFTIAGENLASVTAIEFSPPSRITVSNVRATANSITAQVVIEDNVAAAAERTVTVVSPAGRSNARTFTIRLRTGPFLISNLRAGPGSSSPSGTRIPIVVDFDDPTGSFTAASGSRLVVVTVPSTGFRVARQDFSTPEGLTTGETRGTLRTSAPFSRIQITGRNIPIEVYLSNTQSQHSNTLSGTFDSQ